MSTTRRRFVAGGLAGMATAANLAAAARAQTPASANGAVGSGRALILTGGVNRGAYQAGAVAGLAQQAGLADGQPLDYDIVAGSSIGAMNAYLVATAQYVRLRHVWREVATRPLFTLKEPYEKAVEQSSGVATRLHAAVALAVGMVGNVKGVVDPAAIEALLDENIDVGLRVFVPSYFSATNLTRKRTEVFVVRGTGELGGRRQERLDAILATRKRPVFHPVSGPEIRSALFASAALPIVFDPVPVTRADGSGKSDEFIDGGLADQVPIDVARRCASSIDIISVDAPVDLEEEASYANAAAIGTAVFGIMQARIIQQTVKLAYAESLLAARATVTGTELEDEEIPIQIRYLRPDATLPGKLGDFTDLAALDAMFEIGRQDALRGWLPFKPSRAYG